MASSILKHGHASLPAMRLPLPRSGPVLVLFLATFLAGCDRPETGVEPPGVEMVHRDSVATDGGFLETFQVSVVRESAAWADATVVMNSRTLDAEVRDHDGDGRVSVGDEFLVELAPSKSSSIIGLRSPDGVLGALEFFSGAGAA